MKTTPPTQQSRFIEATQFTTQDYEVFKTGTAFDNKFRQAGMTKMAEEEKDPKSELSRLGLDNVRRVRVMRDASDAEGKNLQLVYETKTDKRALEAKAFQQDQQKAANIRYTQPVWIPDAKKSLCDGITLIQSSFSELGADTETLATLGTLFRNVQESRLESGILLEARVTLYKLMNSGFTKEKALQIELPSPEQPEFEAIQKMNELVKAENDKRAWLFIVMDEVAALLRIVQIASRVDTVSLLAYSKKLLPQRPPRPTQDKSVPGKYRSNNHGSKSKPIQRA